MVKITYVHIAKCCRKNKVVSWNRIVWAIVCILQTKQIYVSNKGQSLKLEHHKTYLFRTRLWKTNEKLRIRFIEK